MNDAERKIRDAAILGLVDAAETKHLGIEIHPHDPLNQGSGWNVYVRGAGRGGNQSFHGDSIAEACGRAFAYARVL